MQEAEALGRRHGQLEHHHCEDTAEQQPAALADEAFKLKLEPQLDQLAVQAKDGESRRPPRPRHQQQHGRFRQKAQRQSTDTELTVAAELSRFPVPVAGCKARRLAEPNQSFESPLAGRKPQPREPQAAQLQTAAVKQPVVKNLAIPKACQPAHERCLKEQSRRD